MTAHCVRTGPCTEVLLRPARAEDVEALVDVVHAAYRGGDGWTTEAHLVDGRRTEAAEVRRMLEDPAVTLLVAELDGAVVGCCLTRREPPDPGGIVAAELGLLAVVPSVQSRGLGARLLEAHAELQRGAGTDVLRIQVLQSRPELHAWYERHGFRRTGTSVPFAGEIDLLKVDGLGMDVMERPLPLR